MLHQLVIIAGVLSIIGLLIVLVSRAAATPTASPGGTYSDWYFPSTGYSGLEWTFVPLKDPSASLASQGLLHYYAYNFAVAASTSAIGRGYAGFQSNGIFNGISLGKAINFSIWGSNGGTSPNGLVNPANSESGGYQIMLPYVWTTGHHYRFQLKAGTTPTDSQGKWWALWVIDQTTGSTTLVGQQRVPTTIGGLASTTLDGHTSMFGEDTHWWKSLTGSVVYNCSDFQNSSLAASNITANAGTIHPASLTTSTNSGKTNTGSNGYITTNCPVQVYSNAAMDVQHNLGYWSPAAVNSLVTASKVGDLNGDGSIGIADLSILAAHWHQSATPAQGDLSGDSTVTVIDLSILAAKWGT